MHYCHLLFDKLGLFFFCISTCLVHQYVTAFSWKIAHTPQLTYKEAYKLLLWFLPWAKISLILFVVFLQQSARTMTRLYFFVLTLSDSIYWTVSGYVVARVGGKKDQFLFFFLSFFIWGKGGRLTLHKAFFTWRFAPSIERGGLKVKAWVQWLCPRQCCHSVILNSFSIMFLAYKSALAPWSSELPDAAKKCNTRLLEAQWVKNVLGKIFLPTIFATNNKET